MPISGGWCCGSRLFTCNPNDYIAHQLTEGGSVHVQPKGQVWLICGITATLSPGLVPSPLARSCLFARHSSIRWSLPNTSRKPHTVCFFPQRPLFKSSRSRPQPKSSRPRYQTLPDAIRLHKLGVDIEGDEDVTAVYTGTGEADYGDSDLACLASWSHLRTVKLAGPRLTLASVQYLRGLKELKKLYVGVGGGPEEQALSVISGLTQFD